MNRKQGTALEVGDQVPALQRKMQVWLESESGAFLEKKAYSKEADEDAQQIVVEQSYRNVYAQEDRDTIKAEAGSDEGKGH